jgi:hypothetical protein
MIVFGGNTVLEDRRDPTLLNDTWQLSMDDTTWAFLGYAEHVRSGHTAIYDPDRQRMIVYGGIGVFGVATSDVLAFDLTRDQWSTLSPGGPIPPRRSLHSAVYDADHDRMLIFGGHIGGDLYVDLYSGGYEDTWSLEWGDARHHNRHEDRAGVLAQAMSPSGPPMFGILSLGPNPTRSETDLTVALLGIGPATIELLDVQGRRSAARTIIPGEGGPHRVVLPETATLSPGLYFVRLTQAGQSVTRRLVVVR